MSHNAVFIVPSLLLHLLLSSVTSGLATSAVEVTEHVTPLALEQDKPGPKLTPAELEAALESGLARFERSADQWTQRATDHWQHQIADVLGTFQKGLSGGLDRERRRRDFPDLPAVLWHSYQYGTGVGNREELTLHGFYSGLQLNVSGPALDAPPQWQVVSHRDEFFLFGLYPFAGTTKLHIVKTDFKGVFLQHTVDFKAAELRVTPFLHHVRASQRSQLFAFVKRTVSVTGLLASDPPKQAEQVLCLLVDRDTLRTTEVCSPITLSEGAGTAELLVDVLHDPYSGSEIISLFPVRQTHGLVAYKLSQLPYSDPKYNLGQHAAIETNSSVWKVRLFSVSGSSYVVITYGDGPLESMIQVFRYDSGSFSLVQTLSATSFVIDIEVFSIGFQHYLALGQESQMSVYIWSYSEFQLLQEEESKLTYKWSVIAVKSCRHEVILAKVHEDSGYQLEFYRHNVQTQRFEAMPPVPCANGVRRGEDLNCFRHPEDVLDLVELVGVTTDDATYVIVPSKQHQLLLVTVNATVDFAPDPIRVQNEMLLTRKAQLQARYDSLIQKEKRLERVLSSQVVPGSHQEITGQFNFLGQVTAETLDAPDAALHEVHLAGYSGDVLRLVAPLTELSEKVEALEIAILTAADRLQDVVRKDASSIVISGEKSMISSVTIDSLEATGAVFISTVDGADLNSTLYNMVRLDSDRLISGTKTVTGAVTVSSDLTVARLNGRPLSDIVTIDTIQEITGDVRYSAGALNVAALSVDGRVDGVDVTQLALYDGGKLPVPVSIGHLKVDNLTVNLINGQRPDGVFSNVLLNSGGTFNDSVTFEGDVTLTDITINGTLNGEDIASCLSSVVYTDSAQRLDALWVTSASVTGSLVPQTVNSRPFPGGRYVTRGGSHVISGRKRLGRVVAGSVTAARVSGVPVTHLVTLDTDQAIHSLTVTGAHVLGDVTVGGTVDGVTVAPGWLDHLLTNGSQTVNGDVIFSGPVTHLGDLHVSRVNGVPVSNLVRRLVVPSPTHPVTVTGRKKFTSSVTANAINVDGLVNGADPANWLTVSGDQLMVGPLHLAGRGFIANLVVAGSVDGVDVTALMQEAIYTDGEHEQLVLGVKAFTDPAAMSELTIDGQLNGVSAEDVMWTRGTQTVTAPHAYMGSVRAGGLHAYGHLHVADGARVGGMDFSELPERAAAASTDTHTERLIFDRVEVRGDVLADRLNGMDSDQLTSALLRTTGGNITGRWHFDELHVTGSIRTSRGADGYKLDDLRPRTVSLTRGGTMTAPLFFESLVMEQGGELRGDVVLGGTPWEEALGNLASEHQPIVINASKTLSGGLHVMGELRSPSLPLQNLLLVGAEQIITGAVYFHSDVTVHTDLTVQSPINGRYDVTKIEELFVTDTDDAVIEGDLEIWGAAAVSNINITGQLAGVSVGPLLADAVPLSSDVRLTGRLTFLAPVRAASVHLTDGLLNGRDLLQFLSTVRLTTGDNTFRRPVRMAGVTAQTVSASDLTATGRVGGVNFTDVWQRLILLDGEYTFPGGVWTVPELSVAGDLSVLTLNGQRPERLLRLDGAELLDLLVVHGDVHATEVRNGSAETRLNGYNIERELNHRFKLSSTEPQTLMGALTFTGRVTVRGDVELGGLLNGLNVSQIVTLGKDNVVLANLEFSGPVSADRVEVHGLVDGVNFSRCAAGAVYPDSNTTLRGQYAVDMVPMEGSDRDAARSAREAQTEVTDLLRQYEDQQQNFSNFFRSQCEAMRGYYDEMRSTYYAVRYFDELQELTWPDLGTVLSTLVLEESEESGATVLVTYSRLSGGCPETLLLRRRADTGLLQPDGTPLNCGAVRQWRQLQVAGRRLLVSAAERPPPGCRAPLSAVWLWSDAKVQPVQSLDVVASQAFVTAARPGAPAELRLLDTDAGQLRRYSYSETDRGFVPHPPQLTSAEVLAVHTLPDSSLLVVSGEGSTVVARREYPPDVQHHDQHHDHQQEQHGHDITLGALTATALLPFTRRHQTMLAVGDGGWSALLNSPQGVKIFEYFGNGTHRCVPAQHLASLSPAGMALLSTGSLPDLFLAVLERDNGLRIFIDKGETGFVEFQRIAVPGAESVVVLPASEDSSAQLLVSAGSRLVLLEARMMGARVPPLHTDCSPRLPPLAQSPGGRASESGVTGISAGEAPEQSTADGHRMGTTTWGEVTT